MDSLTVSPTQLLARLNALRSLQEAARDKLQRQQLLCRREVRESDDDARTTVSIQRALSKISAESSYRTLQSLLQDSQNHDPSPHSAEMSRNNLQRIHSCERIDGVMELNLSQESEFIFVSPSSGASKTSYNPNPSTFQGNSNSKANAAENSTRKCIELDDIPIPSTRKDFEMLVLDKIQKYNADNRLKDSDSENVRSKISTRSYLRRGEGLSRFGIQKADLVIQNTKSLPWRRRCINSIPNNKSCHRNSSVTKSIPCSSPNQKTLQKNIPKKVQSKQQKVVFSFPKEQSKPISLETVGNDTETDVPKEPIKKKSQGAEDAGLKETINIQSNRPKSTKTWATILTQEQDTFLRQLKQSSYYRNFESPAKSFTSQDVSSDDCMHQLQHEKEVAEQNLFDLLENKVSSASFCSQSSFLQRFIHSSKPDCSGDDTPMVLQRCLANNPKLIELLPLPQPSKASRCNDDTEQTVDDRCGSECNDCDRESCSSTSSCCSCKTIEEANSTIHTSTPQTKDNGQQTEKKPETLKDENDNAKLDQTVTATDMKAEMAEMHAKLVATSELLKERLKELEAEIETFREENGKLTTMRKQFDEEKQHFYNEKSRFEQKSNEDKILSEYYFAEEKEKLAKQKQVYERYIREMRGRLNKKEKDEVISLKKEIEELKDEFRTKESRSTAFVARLRTQVKMLDKEKNDLKEECEKLKKENKRIQQVNTNTRRLSNIKYLAEINKKLAQIDTNEKMVKVTPDDDSKYKSVEMQNRGRAKKLLPTINRQIRARAKSVPNLAVTSRYAKYFSERDAATPIERETASLEDIVSVHSDNSSDIDYNTLRVYENDCHQNNPHRKYRKNCQNDDDSLESMYSRQFQSTSDMTGIQIEDCNGPESCSYYSQVKHDGDDPCDHSALRTSSRFKSPVPPLNLTRSTSANTLNRSKSPVSILSNKSSMGSQKCATNDQQSPLNCTHPESMRVHSSEDISSRSLTRTNLNPIEIKRPDGTRELRFPNGNVKIISADGKTSKFIYYNGDIKETLCDEGKIKYYYADTNTYHTTHADGLEVLQFPDGQVEKRYADGSVEIRLPNGSVRYTDPRNKHVSEEWRFPDGAVLTVSRDGEQVVRFPNGQVEVHAKDHKRREYPDGTVKLVYSDGTSETRYSSGRVRIKDPQGSLILDSAPSR